MLLNKIFSKKTFIVLTILIVNNTCQDELINNLYVRIIILIYGNNYNTRLNRYIYLAKSTQFAIDSISSVDFSYLNALR